MHPPTPTRRPHLREVRRELAEAVRMAEADGEEAGE